MVLQTHFHGNSGFPFHNNGLCNGGLEQFTKQQQQHQHQQQQSAQQQQQLQLQVYTERQGYADPDLLVRDSNSFNSLPNYLATQFQMQREEMDKYIRQKNEELRSTIELYENQQVAKILRETERRTLLMMVRKEEEFAIAMQKRRELEEFIKGMEVEIQEWKRMAAEKEATVLSLCKALEEEKEKQERMLAINDAESCLGGGNINKGEDEEDTAENQLGEQIEHKDVCKHCFTRRSCFLFLPCRHLVSCKACETILHACPICGLLKKASIETLFF